MANKHFKQPSFSLLQQKVALRSAYKDAECNINTTKKQLFWYGTIKPTAFSKEYKVLILYKLWESPKVWVLGDELEKLDSKDFPHEFEVDVEAKMVRICLYRYSEFNVHKLLADTIVPWTVEWLFFYEMWLATGEWLGGGEHPGLGKEKESKEAKEQTGDEQKYVEKIRD